VGGKGTKLLGVVARHADEWNCGGGQPPETVRRLTGVLEEACRAIGRDPRAIRRSWMGGFLVGENGAALERRARKLQDYVPPRAATPTAKLPDELRRAGWLVGTPEEIIGQMRLLVAEGIGRFNLQFFDQEDLDALRIIAEQVMPHVASA